MKILLVGTVSSSIFGFRKGLLESLVNYGHDVYILTTDLTPEIQKKARDELNVKALSYSMSRAGTNPFRDLFNTWKLYKIIRNIGPDCVFCYFSKPVIWGALAAKFAGVNKRYGMLEGLGYYFTNTPYPGGIKKWIVRNIQVLLFRISLPTLHGLLFLNHDDKKELIDKSRIHQQNYLILGGIGVDLDEFQYTPLKDGNIRFIFIGRLLAEKGINEYLSAAEKVKFLHPNSEFIVLGGADPSNPGSVDLKRLTELKENNIIIYPGVVSNVADWIAKSSVFVLPSYREGVPRSTQEAMAIGRAIITTDVPGCRETIIDGYNGFKVCPFDSSQLVDRMCKFIDEPELIEVMGKHSREIAEEKFNERIVNDKLISFLGLNVNN